MKFCSHCGKELLDEAVVCPGCGCAADTSVATMDTNVSNLLSMLSQRVYTNGIIWLIIGILQLLGGIFINWFLLIVGGLNVALAVSDMSYSKNVLQNPTGIVKKFEPLTGPIITLIYNLIVGGVIGVIGSIYYFVQIRNLVMEKKAVFQSLESPI